MILHDGCADFDLLECTVVRRCCVQNAGQLIEITTEKCCFGRTLAELEIKRFLLGGLVVDE